MAFVDLEKVSDRVYLVGAEKTWCGGVDCATGAGDVCQCTEPCHVGEGYCEPCRVGEGYSEEF